MGKVKSKIINLARINQVNRKYNCNISLNANIDKSTVFEGRNTIYSKTTVFQSEVGLATYISASCTFVKTKIGRYCSIGPNVKVIGGNHPTSNYVSTHPIFYTKRIFSGLSFENNNSFNEYSYTDISEKYLCEIGNDVWIGQDVILINGVKIGDGAIITAGAVVTKDVPDYSIVGGIPAKLIKSRFNEAEKDFISNLRWWNKSEKWIKEYVNYFDDVKKLQSILLKVEV